MGSLGGLSLCGLGGVGGWGVGRERACDFLIHYIEEEKRTPEPT